jgi:tRNA G10  N-methylase Trm11
MRRFIPIYVFAISLISASCSCDGEAVMKGMMWGFNKIVGEGYIPSAEIMALGEFESVEVNVSQEYINGENQGTIDLRLFNGKSAEMRLSEENVARKCAELYSQGYSKIEDYKTIKISFIQTDPFNTENYAISEYTFEVKDLLTSPNSEENGI